MTKQTPDANHEQVLYVYRCSACGYRGEQRLPGDCHDGEEKACSVCGATVNLEWDGGVTLVPGNRNEA